AATRAGSGAFAIGVGHKGAAHGLSDRDSVLGDDLPAHARLSVARAWRAAGVWCALWLVPVALIVARAGAGSTFGRIALFFSEMAVVTFGGAYAALAYVAQQAVGVFGWLQPGEMLDGLGMAETTPGPLIMVTQFVGFMAAFRDPAGLDPFVAGTLGGLLTTWVTFTPCFLWIFLGAPFIERLRGNRALSGALSAITAAVVGVILNLALWFALHTWFHQARPLWWRVEAPVLGSLDVWALGLSGLAMIAVFGLRAGVVGTLLGCAALSLGLHLTGLR
ncbi:MAG: chromate transporter, partial [Acetobacteraceae bacterium]|nr:chromate transporter [Acetobacteraceae bacterium]